MKQTHFPICFDCNDNCISCPVSRKETKENPTLNVLLKQIKIIREHSDHIELNGGEPTLNKDFFKIINYCNKLNFKEINILSNVKLFSIDKIAKKLSLFKNIKIITTLYGHNSKIQDSITQTPNSFKQKIKGINNLIQLNIPIDLRVLVHKMNSEYFSEIANFLIENYDKENFKQISIMYPKLTFGANKNLEKIFEPMSITAKKIEIGTLNLIKNNFNTKLYHFPSCILPNSIKKYSAGYTMVLNEAKKIEKCENCIQKNNCSGIWNVYLKIQGEDEFKPIKENE